jgi:hypothetical protein
MNIKIAIINMDIMIYCFVSTCAIEHIKKVNNVDKIYFIIKDKSIRHIFAFSDDIIVLCQDEITDVLHFDIIYDLTIINKHLSKNFQKKYIANNNCILHDNDIDFKTYYNKTLFSIYNSIVNNLNDNQTFSIKYVSNCKKIDDIGLFINEKECKKEVVKNLINAENKFSIFYIKKNLFKTLDIINKYEYIITDDIKIYFLCLFLNKKIIFIPHNNKYFFKIGY